MESHTAVQDRVLPTVPEKVKWPTEMGLPPSLYFNAGMFVFEPSLTTYEDLWKTLKITPSTPFAEQVIDKVQEEKSRSAKGIGRSWDDGAAKSTGGNRGGGRGR